MARGKKGGKSKMADISGSEAKTKQYDLSLKDQWLISEATTFCYRFNNPLNPHDASKHHFTSLKTK